MTEGRRIPPSGDHARRIPPDVCCTRMAARLSEQCGRHADPFDCPDNVIYWSAPFDEYGLIVHDGGTSYLLVEYCPWCGRRLPESKRDRWFDELERLGIKNPSLDDAQEPYASDAWYRKAQ